MMNKLLRRTLPILLAVSVVLPTVTGCGMNQAQQVSANIVPQVDTDQIVKATTQAILERIEDQPTVETVIESAESVDSSDAWEEYIGDFETFVYGLLSNELKYKYDVFPAYVVLNDGTEVYGIGYTDYADCYASDDESEVIFEAGLIPYYGEIDIPDEDFNSGLYLYDIDYQDDNNGFILAYKSEEFYEHCVVYNKYLKYGVDSQGNVYYETDDFDKENCDVDLGALYSFDESKYLYDTDFGIYTPIAGSSLSTLIDYEELEKEINNVLEEQDFNFASVDVESYAYFAQDAIQNYLLSIQEETFLGYDVDYLVELVGQIDPTECYRITNDGLMVVEPDDFTGNEATALVKWLVGTGCVVVTAVGIVGAMVSIECPPLAAAAGAMAGTGIEIFMQVVISGKALDSVQWSSVVLAAATGAVSGFLGPYVLAKYEGVAYFFVDSAIDGVLGGVEKSVETWLNGESGKNIVKQFGYGFALGFALSAGFKGVGKVIEKTANSIGPAISKMGEKVFPKLAKKVSDFTGEVGNKLYTLKKVADSSVFHSKYVSDKIAWRQIDRILSEGSDELVNKSFRELNKNSEVLDVNDEVITKEALRDLWSSVKI